MKDLLFDGFNSVLYDACCFAVSDMLHLFLIVLFRFGLASPSGKFCGQAVGIFPIGWVSIEVFPETSTWLFLRYSHGEQAFTGFSIPVPFEIRGNLISLPEDGPVDPVAYFEHSLRLPKIDWGYEWVDDRVPLADCALVYDSQAGEFIWPPTPEWAAKHGIPQMVFRKGQCAGPSFGGRYSFKEFEIDIDLRNRLARFGAFSGEVVQRSFISSQVGQMIISGKVPGIESVAYEPFLDDVIVKRSDGTTVVLRKNEEDDPLNEHINDLE